MLDVTHQSHTVWLCGHTINKSYESFKKAKKKKEQVSMNREDGKENISENIVVYQKLVISSLFKFHSNNTNFKLR